MANLNGVNDLHILGKIEIDGEGTLNGSEILHETKVVFEGEVTSTGTINYDEPIKIEDYRFVLVEITIKHTTPNPIQTTIVYQPAEGQSIYCGANGPNNEYQIRLDIYSSYATLQNCQRSTLKKIIFIR